MEMTEEIYKVHVAFEEAKNPTTPKPQSVPLPDFRARLRKTWGSRVFSDAEVDEMREADLHPISNEPPS